MKNIKQLAVVALLGLGACGLAIAQVHRDGAANHGDPATMAKHLSEVFPQVAAFDGNKDGKLDDAEKKALGKAIEEGKLQLPAHTPPHGGKPTAGMMLNHIGEMYAHVSAYDANHDGDIDDKEQAAIKSAIEAGKFAPHGKHRHENGQH